MAQKQTKKATKVAKAPTIKKNFGLSDKAIACLTVGCLFENKTESEMVEGLINTYLVKYTAYCDGRKFIAFPTKSESAIQGSQVESPILESK
jgi:hypothetical protein